MQKLVLEDAEAVVGEIAVTFYSSGHCSQSSQSNSLKKDTVHGVFT